MTPPTSSKRVEALLAGLNLRRKAAQMVQAERLHITPAQMRRHRIGSVLSGAGSVPGANRPADWVAMNDAYWEACRAGEETEPAIPPIYAVDAVHGHNNVRGATVFPHNIGLGAARDPELLRRIARITALEVRATGVDWTLAPTVAVALDPRWGRFYESYSSDPELVAECAESMVAGLQEDIDDGPGVPACAKHWIGDGGTAAGVDQGETLGDEAELRRLHLPGYLAAMEAGVLSIMVSLSSWRGERCHAHRYLVTDLLKGELGFRGLVVSDWNGILAVADDFDEAVARSVNAGIDLFMVPELWERFIESTVRGVESGAIPESRVDDAARRILRVKEACGLLDAPRPSARRWSNDVSFGCAEHRAVAREAVRKSVVLLKDEGGLLPLDPNARILVAGRNADDRGALCGGFTVEWQGVRGNERIEGGTSIWEGIRELAPNALLVSRRDAASDEAAPDAEAAAASTADADAAIVVIGEHPYAEGMGDIRDWTPPPDPAPAPQATENGAEPAPPGPGLLEPYGNSLRLSRLHPEDLATLRAFADRGVPVVAVLVSGRPLVVEEELAASDAFMAAWLPGSEGGGVADVLFGLHDVQGRLAHPWPAADPEGDELPPAAFPRQPRPAARRQSPSSANYADGFEGLRGRWRASTAAPL